MTLLGRIKTYKLSKGSSLLILLDIKIINIYFYSFKSIDKDYIIFILLVILIHYLEITNLLISKVSNY